MKRGLKLLDIDVTEFDKRMKLAKAVKWPEKKLRRNVYSLDEQNWIKLRDEGDQVMLDIIKGEKIQRSKLNAGFEKASVVLHDLGHVPKAYHELRATSYLVGNIMVDVVQWPKIPPYAEFTGPKAKVEKLISKLGFSVGNASKVGTKELFKIYGINIEKQKHLKF